MTEGPEPVASQGGERTDRTLLRLDRPIQSEDEDLFGWSNLAKRLADRIGELDLSNGAVVGIDGPWGSGKTSLMNLLRSELRARGFTPLDFNAWAFQDAQDVSRAFMIEIAAQTGLSSNVAESLRKLADYMSMMKGALVLDLAGTAGQILGKAFDDRAVSNQSLRELRNSITENLRSQPSSKYAVFIDDIDRLHGEEIILLFKTVRVVCDFPQIAYVIAYDRDYLSSALGNLRMTGANYIDKIVQITFDVPILSEAQIKRFLLESIVRIYPDLMEFGREVLHNAIKRYMLPAIRTPRQLCRYLYSLKSAAEYYHGPFDEKVPIFMELLRICDNRVYRALRDHIDLLTGHIRNAEDRDAEVAGHIEEYEEGSEEFRKLCERSAISRDWAESVLMEVFPNVVYTGKHERLGLTEGFRDFKGFLSYLTCGTLKGL